MSPKSSDSPLSSSLALRSLRPALPRLGLLHFSRRNRRRAGRRVSVALQSGQPRPPDHASPPRRHRPDLCGRKWRPRPLRRVGGQPRRCGDSRLLCAARRRRRGAARRRGWVGGRPHQRDIRRQGRRTISCHARHAVACAGRRSFCQPGAERDRARGIPAGRRLLGPSSLDPSRGRRDRVGGRLVNSSDTIGGQHRCGRR